MTLYLENLFQAADSDSLRRLCRFQEKVTTGDQYLGIFEAIHNSIGNDWRIVQVLVQFAN
jgi:hypothetical protein